MRRDTLRPKGRRSFTWGAALAALSLAVATAAPARAVTETTRSCVQLDGRVRAVLIVGSTALLGGNFTRVRDTQGKWHSRGRLAAVNTQTCALLPWAPNANAEVVSLHVNGGRVYLGGAFTAVNGVARSRLASVGFVDGALTGFSPAVNGIVRSIVVYGGRIYVGGDFGMIGTAVRSNLAAFTASTGALDAAWKPAVNGKVTAMRLSPDFARLYVAGRFTSLAGSTSAAYIGALRPATGALDAAFLPRPGWPVESLAVDSRGVHLGGGGSTGGHVAAYSAAGAALFNRITVDGDVQALALDGDLIHAGGHFTNLCVGGTGGGSPFRCARPSERRKALAVALSTGSVTSWSPSFNSPLGAWSAAVDPSTHQVWVGGDFTTVNGRSVQHLAVFR